MPAFFGRKLRKSAQIPSRDFFGRLERLPQAAKDDQKLLDREIRGEI
jgi:hypothetical protein